MTSAEGPSAKPTSPRPRRPWYLVAALLVAWLVGSEATMEGWAEMSLFHNGTIDSGQATDAAEADKSLEAQAIDEARRERAIDALFQAKKRVLPLGIASGVLGVAIWAFSIGAMAGRKGGRRLLVQVIAVHGALAVLTYVLTPDVRRVEVAIGHEAEQDKAAEMADAGTNAAALEQARAIGDRVVDLVPLATLMMALFGHGAILVALTRKRTLAFYDVAGS